VKQHNLALLLQQHIQQIHAQLASIDLDHMARQSGFLKRLPRKIPMPNLVLALLALATENTLSVERAATLIGKAADTSYSKQAFHKRLGQSIEAFPARLAIFLFGSLDRSSRWMEALAPFPRVLVHDSTVQTLPAHLASVFPGSSNQSGATQAAVKVQLAIDLKSGNVRQLSLSSFRRNDQAAAPDLIDIAQPGDLVLRDLGYWVLSVFRALALKGVYFLSRYRHGTALLDPRTGKALDLLHILRTQGQIDQEVLLGEQYRLPVRLVALPVPEPVANERRRKARANRDQRLCPSRAHLFLLGWNIFVTNVPARVWSDNSLLCVYRLRWRIEMIFKAWKSHLGFRQLNCRTAALLRLSLMTKLLFCLLVCNFCHRLELLQAGHHHVSLLRLAKVMGQCGCLISAAILDWSPEQWLAWQLEKHVFYETRADRYNFYQVFTGLSAS
jgi:hypothetical protein